MPIRHHRRGWCSQERPTPDISGRLNDFDCNRHEDCVEDLNGNGELDEGEDQNGNGRLDSNGRCVNSGRFAQCTYDECFNDEICGGTVCLCRPEGSIRNNRCLSRGNCLTDQDCGENGYCSPTLGNCGNYGGVVGYFCHTPDDLCVNDSECMDSRMGPGSCRFISQNNRWECEYTECVGK